MNREELFSCQTISAEDIRLFVQLEVTQQYSLFAVKVRNRPGEPKPSLADAGLSFVEAGAENLDAAALPGGVQG